MCTHVTIIKAVVAIKSEKLQTYMKGQQEMTYFNMVAYASTSQFVNIRCSQKHKFSTMAVGRTYNFNNIVERNRHSMVSSSTAGMTLTVMIPAEKSD